MKYIGDGLTFDDVLLLPGKSSVLPSETDLRMNLTEKIQLSTPLMSAGMDTVTESQMAIAMAREGGIGIIHKNMSIEQQREEIDRVRRSERGVITNLFSLKKGHLIEDAARLMEHCRISGAPIIDTEGRLEGIITNRDIRFETDLKVPIDDIMIKENLTTGKQGITMDQVSEVTRKYKIEKLPPVDDQDHLTGLITIKDIKKSVQYPSSARDSSGRPLAGAAIGVTSDVMERVKALRSAAVDAFVIDTVHGQNVGILKAIKEIKKTYPDIQLIAGNIVIYQGTIDLIEAGADCVRVGVGSGSICITRAVTRIGVSQISAVMACVQAGKEKNIPVIADGDAKYSGDVTKATAVGGDVVMLGSMFAGTEESPEEEIYVEGRHYKLYRGMGSLEAMDSGSPGRYFQNEIRRCVPEGVEGRVPYKGKVGDVVCQLVGGPRSGTGYIGAANIRELKEESSYMKITPVTLQENHPHNIIITRESPSYISKLDR